MIFKIRRSCPLLAFGIRGRNCAGNDLSYKAQDFTLIVFPLVGCVVERLPAIWDEGCGRFSPLVGPRWQNTVRRSGRRILYRAMERDESGKIVFILDDKILGAEPGRWRGELSHCGKPIGVIEIQLAGGLEVDCVENTTRAGCTTVSCEPAVCN